MTQTQKRWLSAAAIMLVGVAIATDFHPDRLPRLPLWSWGVLLLEAGLIYSSRLWLRPERWQTTKLRYGLAYGGYFGLSLFLLRLAQDATQSAPAWGNATFTGLSTGLLMGLIMGASYASASFQRNVHGS